MQEEFIKLLFEKHKNAEIHLPVDLVNHWADELLEFLFPAFTNKHFEHYRDFQLYHQEVRLQLFNILNRLEGNLDASIETKENLFSEALPELRAMLCEDAAAICAGDPAAKSTAEVVQTYPGFYAIAIHRIAHLFVKMKIPSVPRILAEYAHGKTGIDIHPGATIGKRFCIDHGTGIVIGETVNIGDNVKIYQGVTLGALSVEKELAQTKRHPTIENNVVIYAGATILGGETTIGEDSIIGGNVWITKSVAPNSKIYYQK